MKSAYNGFLILILIFILVTVIFVATRNNAQIRLNERIALSFELNNEANRLLNENEYEKAREKLRQSLELNKLNPRIYSFSSLPKLPRPGKYSFVLPTRPTAPPTTPTTLVDTCP